MVQYKLPPPQAARKSRYKASLWFLTSKYLLSGFSGHCQSNGRLTAIGPMLKKSGPIPRHVGFRWHVRSRGRSCARWSGRCPGPTRKRSSGDRLIRAQLELRTFCISTYFWPSPLTAVAKSFT